MVSVSIFFFFFCHLIKMRLLLDRETANCVLTFWVHPVFRAVLCSYEFPGKAGFGGKRPIFLKYGILKKNLSFSFFPLKLS